MPDFSCPPFAERGTREAQAAEAIRRASIKAALERLPAADALNRNNPHWPEWRPQIIANIKLILALHTRPAEWFRAAELAGYIADPLGPVQRVIQGGAPPPVMALNLLVRAAAMLRGHRVWSEAPTYAERKLVWSNDNSGCPALCRQRARAMYIPPRTGSMNDAHWEYAIAPACPLLGGPCPTAPSADSLRRAECWEPGRCEQLAALRALAEARRRAPEATVRAEPCPFAPVGTPCIPGGYERCAKCSRGYHASKQKKGR